MRRLLSLLPPLFSLVLLAGPLAPVHAAPPKELTWVPGPTGNLRAAVDGEGALWIDSGRPRRLGLLDGHLQQLVVAETSVHLVLEKRAGLSVSSEWRHLDSKGELLGRAVVPAMVESLLPRADGALVLIPGWIYRFKDGAPPTAPVPLPWWESRIRLEAGGQSTKGPQIVRGNLSWAVDPETGCTREPWPIDGAYSATRAGIRARQCGLEAPPEQPDRSRLLREDLIKLAITNGDLRSLVALQADSAEITALRPAKAAAPGPYKTAKNDTISLPADIPRIMPGDLVAYVEGAELPPSHWIGKAEAPACLATIVVAVADPERLSHWEETRQRLSSAGVMCADSLVLIPKKTSLLPNEEKSGSATGAAGPSGVLYLLAKNVGESSISTEKQAMRLGEPALDRIRLDLARLLGDASPLAAVATTLELSPEWTAGSGPGGDLILDVDGSWVAGVGFGLARGTPTGLRVQEVPLGGPVEGIRVTDDGAYEVTVADQGARVLFEGGSFGVEHGTVLWLGKDLEIKKPRGPILSGWVLSPDGVQAPGSSRTVSLGSALGRAFAWEGGLIVQTSYGLIGLGQDGRPLWRVSQVKDWAFSDGMLITTGPRGVLGFRPPKRLDGEEATNPDAEQELYDTSESTDPAGGSRKGGPPGPGGGKPGGGNPGGGKPGGGNPGGGKPGGDPGGGKPGGGGR